MKKRAFTLIEIMIVVAIIGLLAAIITPSVNNAKKMSHKASELGISTEELRTLIKEGKVEDPTKNPKKHSKKFNELSASTKDPLMGVSINPETIKARYGLGSVIRHKVTKLKGVVILVSKGDNGPKYKVRFADESNNFSEVEVNEFELEASY